MACPAFEATCCYLLFDGPPTKTRKWVYNATLNTTHDATTLTIPPATTRTGRWQWTEHSNFVPLKQVHSHIYAPRPQPFVGVAGDSIGNALLLRVVLRFVLNSSMYRPPTWLSHDPTCLLVWWNTCTVQKASAWNGNKSRIPVNQQQKPVKITELQTTYA